MVTSCGASAPWCPINPSAEVRSVAMPRAAFRLLVRALFARLASVLRQDFDVPCAVLLSATAVALAPIAPLAIHAVDGATAGTGQAIALHCLLDRALAAVTTAICRCQDSALPLQLAAAASAAAWSAHPIAPLAVHRRNNVLAARRRLLACRRIARGIHFQSSVALCTVTTSITRYASLQPHDAVAGCGANAPGTPITKCAILASRPAGLGGAALEVFEEASAAGSVQLGLPQDAASSIPLAAVAGFGARRPNTPVRPAAVKALRLAGDAALRPLRGCGRLAEPAAALWRVLHTPGAAHLTISTGHRTRGPFAPVRPRTINSDTARAIRRVAHLRVVHTATAHRTTVLRALLNVASAILLAAFTAPGTSRPF
mmetsp:Transcript_87788/g.160641  ORF Transcript_87788/g.160641 Transcript_87788/m.160641 type:complete len:372 (+) Transcript_87788:390-1505(+)